MSSASGDDDAFHEAGTSTRRSGRLQYVAGDYAEVVEGDILAVKPCKPLFFLFAIHFDAVSLEEGPSWLCEVIENATKPQTRGIKVTWLTTPEPGDEFHMQVCFLCATGF